MAHFDVEPAIGRGAAGLHLGVHGATDHVASGAFELFIVIAHESPHGAIEEMATHPAQALFEHGAGHARVLAGE